MAVDGTMRAQTRARFGFGMLVAMAAGAALAAAPLPQLTSAWRTKDIRVDGVNMEWTTLDELPNGPAVAFANDDAFLYVIVTATDPQVRREIAQGVILWFDPTHDKKQTFGIGMLGTPPPYPPSGASPDAADATAPLPDPLPMDQFDVYGPGKDQRRLVRLDPAFDIQMAAGLQQGTLAYELKIPLVQTDARQFAVGAKPGETIDVEIATPQAPSMPSESAGRPGGGFGGFGGGFGGMGMGGRGGRGGGMRGGDRSSQSGARAKPIKVWAALHLAAAPPETPPAH